MGTPDLNHNWSAWLRYPAGLAKRRDYVGCEEERRKPGDEVESVIVVGKCFHIADTQVCFGDSSSRELDQGLGCVETERFGTAVGHEA